MQVATLCQAMDSRRQQLSQALSHTDRMVSVIYHDIELTHFDAATGYRLAKVLQEVLQNRRAVKQEQAFVNATMPLVAAMERYHRSAARSVKRVGGRVAGFGKHHVPSALAEVAATSAD